MSTFQHWTQAEINLLILYFDRILKHLRSRIKSLPLPINKESATVLLDWTSTYLGTGHRRQSQRLIRQQRIKMQKQRAAQRREKKASTKIMRWACGKGDWWCVYVSCIRTPPFLGSARDIRSQSLVRKSVVRIPRIHFFSVLFWNSERDEST